MSSKPFWMSKTLWANVAAIVLVAVQAADGAPWMDPEMQAVILAVVNAVLRLTTTQSLR
jgi:hypothetical protein